MSAERRSEFAFGPFRLLPAERRLEKDGQAVRLGGRAFDLLTILVDHAGEVVSSRVLLERVWRGLSVEESSLRANIKALRKALWANQPEAEYVANVPGRGYCFVAPVERLDRARLKNAQADAPIDPPGRVVAIIGRSDSIAAVCRDVSQSRLVTIAGPAGVGKTTLAIAASQALADPVRFVDLAPVQAPSLVISALASALGVAIAEIDPLQEVVQFLRDKRILVVLDNCEQVVESVAALADRLLRDTVEPRILATSREPLRIPGERVHRLMPLECPPIKESITADEAMAYSAIQLFVERASAGGPFALDDALAPAAAEICRRLDGIPLAIELAAARAEFFGLVALSQRLNDMFAVLTQGRRFALPRHQTLRATMDWGYQLLSPTEQIVLRRIAVFRTAFKLEAALAVIGPQISFESAVEILANLVAKSLLTAQGAGGAAQYRLLEATRIYAGEKLAASDDGHDTALRHAEHHLKLLLSGQDQAGAEPGRDWLRRCAACLDDIRGALDWSLSPDGDQSMGLDLMAASAQLWFQLSLNLEHRERIERVVQHLEPGSDPVVEMRLQIALGHAYWYTSSDPAKTEPAFARALALSERMDSAPAQFRLQALWGMWASRRARGQYRQALEFAKRYEAVAEAAADPGFMLLGDRILGLTRHYLGDQASARRLMERVQGLARGAPNPPNTDFQLGPEIAAAALLPRILWLQGLPDQASAALNSVIEAARRSDHWFSLYYVLGLSGCPLSLWTGDLVSTEKYLGMMVNRSASDVWLRCWTFILRLHKGTPEEALIASFLEPRLDMSTFATTLQLARKGALAIPLPDEDVGDALWSLPEVLRVNAELALWRGGPDAATAAETGLLRALDLARDQSALSWELRSALSLARLWRDRGRAAEARDLLAGTYDQFTEGFASKDLADARVLIAELA
jgi:predicted ATPase/DNA-binding winged helix-turn-helix (wHTH) protein